MHHHVQGISYTVVQDLQQEPVTIADFKQHARIDFNTDDNLIDLYLKSARQYLEQWSQLSFGDKIIRFRAISVPDYWQLMYGPYQDDTRLTGDILIRGGHHVDEEFTTGWPNDHLPDAIKIAICRYAAGLYAIRENMIFSVNGVVQDPNTFMDEAQKMLHPWRNITFP